MGKWGRKAEGWEGRLPCSSGGGYGVKNIRQKFRVRFAMQQFSFWQNLCPEGIR